MKSLIFNPYNVSQNSVSEEQMIRMPFIYRKEEVQLKRQKPFIQKVHVHFNFCILKFQIEHQISVEIKSRVYPTISQNSLKSKRAKHHKNKCLQHGLQNIAAVHSVTRALNRALLHSISYSLWSIFGSNNWLLQYPM